MELGVLVLPDLGWEASNDVLHNGPSVCDEIPIPSLSNYQREAHEETAEILAILRTSQD